MTELTRAERAALSEEDLVDHDLVDVERDPRMSEAAHRNLVRGRIRRERADAARSRRAEEFGVSVHALEAAEAEKRARERDAREERELSVARQAVQASTGATEERLVRYARAALELREPDGTWPTQAAVAERLGVTERSVRQVGWKRIIQRSRELAGSGGTSG